MESSPPSTEKDLLDKLEVRVVVFSLRDNALQALLVRSSQNPAWELAGVPILVNQSLEEAAGQCLGHFIRIGSGRKTRQTQFPAAHPAGRCDRVHPAESKRRRAACPPVSLRPGCGRRSAGAPPFPLIFCKGEKFYFT